jgi:CyaY protein
MGEPVPHPSSDPAAEPFAARAARALQRLEAAIESAADAAGIDVEVSRTDNVIDVELENGSKVIINSHAAAGEIWVAARSGGYHFQPRPAQWIDGRGGRELVAALADELSAQAGQRIDLAAAIDAPL